MKNFIKLFVVVLVAAFMCISCLEKGGTIEVYNSVNGDPLTNSNLFVIVKGVDVAGAFSDLASGRGTTIAKGATKSISFDEDGLYTVVAFYPTGFTYPATLLGGNTVKVTIK